MLVPKLPDPVNRKTVEPVTVRGDLSFLRLANTHHTQDYVLM